MARKIGLGSQKGGVWKSTIARALGVAFTQNDWSVKIIDLDTKQGTCTAWQQRRLRNGITPDVPVQMFGNVATAIAKSSDADLLIFDGAPHATTETVEIAKAVDMMILPTGLSIDDLEPTVTLANTLTDKHGIDPARIVFALCKATSAAEVQAAREYLGKTRFATLDGAIQHKPSYSQAMDAGQSLIETPHPSPRKQAIELVTAAVEKFQELSQ